MVRTINWKLIGIHVVGSISFLLLPILFYPRPSSLQVLLHNFRTLAEAIIYVLLLGFFYLNYYVMIPHFYLKRKYLKYVLLALGCYLVIALLPDVLIPRSDMPRRPGRPPEFEDPLLFFVLGRSLFLFLVVLFFSLMLRIAIRLRQTEKEKLNAEISYLKAQVNPHFLFNTLNGIYALALQRSDETANALVKLSGMMRYVLTEASADHVSLEKEIEYLRNYIELQQLRFGSNVRINFTIEGESQGKFITPLLIIPMVENAFKYGVSPEEKSELTISFLLADNEMKFSVANNKVHIKSVEKTGLGIKNIRKRLALVYPEKHDLRIEESDSSYSISLIIKS